MSVTWPRIEDGCIPVVKDSKGKIHAPPIVGSTVAVCGAIGTYQQFPADHPAIFCPLCLTCKRPPE